MGVVLRIHARSTSRAAIAARSLADNPADLAIRVSSTRAHQAGGRLSRCHHFETLRESTPRSAASASRESHSSITSRYDLNMEPFIRPAVLERKSIVSHDFAPVDYFNRGMGKTEHRQAFVARVKLAREQRFSTQQQISDLLGIPQSKYHKYESRSYMPHDLVHRFCLACGVDIYWLFTGQNRSAVSEEVPTASVKPRKLRTRRKTRAAA